MERGEGGGNQMLLGNKFGGGKSASYEFIPTWCYVSKATVLKRIVG